MTNPPRRRLSAALAGVLAAAGVLGVLAASPARADSLRCDEGSGRAGGIVSTGDTVLNLLGKCGSPTLREDESETLSRLAPAPGGTRATVTAVQRWTYDRGPTAFIQVVRLEGGVVTAVERGGYGYGLDDAPRARGGPGSPASEAAPPVPRARCEPQAIREGDTTLDLLARCGPPATQDERVESSAVERFGPAGPVLETRTRVVELWRYDFGPRLLTRHLTVAGGRVRRVETGGYGYSR